MKINQNTPYYITMLLLFLVLRFLHTSATADEVWLFLAPTSKIVALTLSVVENEAQKAVLLKKQAEVLAGNKKMDLGEETLEPMSEPSIWLLIGFVFVLLFYNRLRMSVANCRE
jgi:hypothetical protein